MELLAVKHAIFIDSTAEIDGLRPAGMAEKLEDMPVGFLRNQHVLAVHAEVHSKYIDDLLFPLRGKLALVVTVHSNNIYSLQHHSNYSTA